MKFVKFLNSRGMDVYINIDNVDCVKQYDCDGEILTQIYSRGHCYLSTSAHIDAIVKKIEDEIIDRLARASS